MRIELSHQHLEAILHQSPISVAIVGTDGTIEYINRRAVDTFGYVHEDIPTMDHWWLLAYPDAAYRAEVQAGWMAKVSAALATGSEIERQEYRVSCKDGSVKTMVIFGIFVAERVLVMFEDVTARREAERRALHASEERFRTFFEGAPIGNCISDLDGRLQHVNRAFAATVLAPAAQLVGQRLPDLVHPDDRETVLHAFEELRLGAMTSYQQELRLRRPDGRFVWAVLTSAVEHDATGQALRLLTHVQDVTERRQLQAGVQQAERLANMGTVAAGVAHEINNPLAYMLFNLEAISADLPRLAAASLRLRARLGELADEGEAARALGSDAELLEPQPLAELTTRAREATDGLQRIRSITQALGTFARGDDETARVDPRRAIESALKVAGNELRHRARVVRELGTVPDVLASESKLAQVFLNLLINASHALDEARLEHNTVTVRTWTEGAEVCAEVVDNGIGIPEELRERIFEPFFSTKKRGEGSGLGLAICRNLVREIGGDIRVHSEVGRGTRFVVRLPACGDSSPERSPAPPKAHAAVPKRRGRILVIDDEPVLRHVLQRMLSRWHEVIALGSGREAMAVLETDRAWDVIFCDMMMPEVAGSDFHSWLADADRPLADRLVFMTGGAFTPRAAEYLATATNLRLEKPFDLAKVRAVIDELMASRDA